MAEYNIFEIIRGEKKKLSSVSIPQVNKVFVKYYVKYITELEQKFLDLETEDNDLNFSNNIEIIGNFIFHIFYSIYLISFNIHISIFFLERATLLFYEFISLSIKEKEYHIESTSHINDAIIFTYKKTMGSVTLDNIINENKNNLLLTNNQIYLDVLQIRDAHYLISKIINKIVYDSEIITEKYKKTYKNISEILINIYQKLNIDKFLFHNINKLQHDYDTPTSIFLIQILLEIIQEFISLDFFEFNNQESDIYNFTNYLDIFFQKFINNNNIEQIILEPDLKKNKYYLEFKEVILRYISN